MSFSKTIQMFIFDGNPNGRIMCELSNWNGRVYKISRNELPEFHKEMIQKIQEYTSSLGKMRRIMILFTLVKLKECSQGLNNI